MRVALALLIAFLLALRLRYGIDNVIDDAYITLRDARNVARGAGVVYNAGEPVLGTTTPLFALLHGAAGALVGPARIPWSAVLGNALADALAALLLASWIGEASRSRAVGLAAAALYALSPRAIEYSSGGMEAPVFTLLVLATLREAARGREVPAGLGAGLAALCRPDGGLVLLFALGVLAWKGRRAPLAFAAAATLVALPWVVHASLVYPYGPVPQSVIAKAHRPWWLEPWQAWEAIALETAAIGEGRLVAFWLPARLALPEAVRSGLVALAALGHVALALAGARALDRDGRRTGTILLLFAVAYAALYGFGNPPMFGWYQVPLEALLAARVAAGAPVVARRAAGPRAARAALAALVALTVVASVRLREHELSWVLRERWDKARERAYFACAARLAGRVPPGETVQISEGGSFGWAFEGRVVDTVGLVSPGAERFYPPKKKPTTNMAVPPGVVLAERPLYFVSLEVFVRDTCLADPAFLAEYELEPSLSDPSVGVFGSRGLLVFRRRR